MKEYAIKTKLFLCKLSASFRLVISIVSSARDFLRMYVNFVYEALAHEENIYYYTPFIAQFGADPVRSIHNK